MKNNIIDSLIYTSIKNNININDPDERFLFLKKETGINDSDDNIAKTKVDSLLTNTTIKRACCMAKRDKDKIDADKNISIQVKIPVPTGGASSSDKVGTKFGFKNVTVKVPSSICDKPEIFGPNYNTQDESGKGNGVCDKFMGAYCNNMKYLYGLENKGNEFDANEFYSYSPECPCYADLPPWTVQQNQASSGGLSRTCVLTNCENTNLSVYLDPSSRASCNSNITFCTEYNTWKGLNASSGGIINIDKKTTQNCSAGDAKTPGGTAGDTSGNNRDTSGNNRDTSGNNRDTSGNNRDTSGKKIDTSGKKIDTSSKKTETITTEESPESSKTMLYLGIGGGIFLLLIICIVIFLVLKNKNKNKNTNTSESR